MTHPSGKHWRRQFGAEQNAGGYNWVRKYAHPWWHVDVYVFPQRGGCEETFAYHPTRWGVDIEAGSAHGMVYHRERSCVDRAAAMRLALAHMLCLDRLTGDERLALGRWYRSVRRFDLARIV